MSIVIGGTFSYLKPSIGIPFLVILFCVSCLSLWKAYSRESIAIPSLLVVLCGIAVAVGQFYLSEPKQLKQLNFATPDALTSPVLRDMDIRICDLTREDFRMKNRTFINCRIYGPAVFNASAEKSIMIRTTIRQVAEEGLFIETTNAKLSGVIGAENCTFTDCQLYKISFIGSPEVIDALKKEFLGTK